ncbi:hypothetical protein AMEX_G10134 [Astyanax mexicanus]|uniref:Uncharacterized protein n=1 Tax=Astyanax mexicanus TaxID=7994 RepID=A0A8T2LW01_ASTMX|nr:hypothetical protein AMEX_G10134 [Astyanax mexicanus]
MKGEIILEKRTENKSALSTEQMCKLAQKLSNYQVCDLDLSPDFKKKMNYTKIETKGLVDNILMNPRNLSCVLSPPVCPSTSNTSLWNRIHSLLDAWSLDVAAYSETLCMS